MAQNNQNGLLSRRRFLQGSAGLGGGLALASFAGAFGMGTAEAAHTNDDPQTILNLAATAEALAVTFYYSAVTGAQFSVNADDVEYLKAAMDAEQYHYEFLTGAGGKALTTQFYVPATVLSDPNVFIKTGLAAETAFVAAYLAATRTFADAVEFTWQLLQLDWPIALGGALCWLAQTWAGRYCWVRFQWRLGSVRSLCCNSGW